MAAAVAIPPERREMLRAADLRYRRQAYELTVPIAEGPVTRVSLDRLAERFHDKHQQTYGHANPAEPVQLVNLRLTAIGRLPKVPMAGLGPAIHEFDVVPQQKRGDRTSPSRGTSSAHARGLVSRHRSRTLSRPLARRLGGGRALAGPAIIEAMDSTIAVPPGWTASVDGNGYIRLRRR